MNKEVSKVLENILKKYVTLSNAELEIRPKKPTREEFVTMYENLRTLKGAKFAGVEQTLNIISKNIYEEQNNRSNYIRQINYKGKKHTGENYIKKTSVLFPLIIRDFVVYSVNLNTEEPTEKFTVKQNAIARFKNRISYTYESWRFDLTVVKEANISDCKAFLKKIVEEVFIDLDENNFLSAISNKHTNRLEIEIEHVGENKELNTGDIKIITGLLFSLIDKNYVNTINSQTIIYEVAKLMIDDPNFLALFAKKRGLKLLLNQVKTIDKVVHSEIYPMEEFLVTEKADGVRTLVYCDGETLYLANKELAEYKITGAPKIVCEGELIGNTLLIFDVMYFGEERLFERPMKIRINFISKVVKVLMAALHGKEEKAKGKSEVVGEDMGAAKGTSQAKESEPSKGGISGPPRLIEKTYLTIPRAVRDDTGAPGPATEKALEKVLKAKYEAKYEYEIDGLILSQPNEDYRATNSYKWKPPEHNSIDFLAIRAPNNILNIKPLIPKEGKDLYILFSAIHLNIKNKLGLKFAPFYDVIFPEYKGKETVYLPIQFCPSANPLEYMYYHDKGAGDINYKVVEMKKNIRPAKRPEDEYRQFSLGDWELMRVRDDRTFERTEDYNNYEIAEKTYMNYLNPLFFEDLAKVPNSYFMFTAPSTYKAKNVYNRIIYNEIIYNNCNEAPFIVDLGTGRGADIIRYLQAGVRTGVFIDNDKDALTELIQRKYSIIKSEDKQAKVGKYRRDKVSGVGMNILIMHANLKDNYESLLMKIYDLGYKAHSKNACVCNFALHYMCDTSENIKNIIELIDHLLPIGGLFVFTVMDGRAVYDLLKGLEKGQKWVAEENGAEKYCIQKLYGPGKMADYGQNIAVKMPFSNEYYEEPLCNVEYLIKLFMAKKYAVELNCNFLEKKDSPETTSTGIVRKLTEIDKDYIKLQKYVTLRKM